jgi:type II secretory pathway component PulF
VEGGDLLNVAMRKIPNFYDEKEIAIVESGEQTGMMKNTFESIARELRMQEDLRRKVVGALTYPFIILIFLLIALVVVMVYVIPQIMPIITEMSGELPWSTRSLVAVSEFMQHNFFLFLLALVAFGLVFMGYTRTESGKRFVDREKLYLPLVGRMYRSYLVVQVMSTFHLLLSSGVSILKALRLTGSSSGNRIVADLYNRVSENVSKGNKLAESFATVDTEKILFSPDILQMIESAEKTSTVHEVTGKISEQYKREVDAALAVMVKFIEPAALLLA